jgi:hypothetical protein
LKHRRTKRFNKCFESLPSDIQDRAREQFLLLKQDSTHPSLGLEHKGRGVWGVRVNAAYRALAAKDGDTFVWWWIGDHDEYDRLIR